MCLLQAAYEEIHCNGFRGTSLEAILRRAGVTKGALYHHFPNKNALGCAMVDEMLTSGIRERFIEPLEQCENPITGLHALCDTFDEAATLELLEQGCPLNNLAQEMSSVDETFRQRIEFVFRTWRESLEKILARGQEKGYVRRELNVTQIATFIVATVEGSIGLAKNAQDIRLFRQCIEGMRQYLDIIATPEWQTKYASSGAVTETPSIS